MTTEDSQTDRQAGRQLSAAYKKGYPGKTNLGSKMTWGPGNKQQRVINQNRLKWRFSIMFNCLFVTKANVIDKQESRHADVMLS